MRTIEKICWNWYTKNFDEKQADLVYKEVNKKYDLFDAIYVNTYDVTPRKNVSTAHRSRIDVLDPLYGEGPALEAHNGMMNTPSDTACHLSLTHPRPDPSAGEWQMPRRVSMAMAVSLRIDATIENVYEVHFSYAKLMLALDTIREFSLHQILVRNASKYDSHQHTFIKIS